MIIDTLENSELYLYNDDLKAAFNYLKSLDSFPSEDGKVEIRGNKVFANIDRYQTKPESDCRMEAHHKYIDIQILFTGKEIITWNPVHDLTETIPYDNDKDVCFYEAPTEPAGKAILSQGIFMLLFPEDAHMPQIAINDIPENIEKIVMKIAVDQAT